MKIIFTALICCILLPAARAQQMADSLLPEAVITAYGQEKAKQHVAAAVSSLNTRDFQRYGEASPVLAFQQLPGVRLEERSPGSFRVSIRGSALRAPFDVRNVKVYWNNLPITEANGSTPLNLLDLSLYQQVEVIRGPAGSFYGAGTGGVINIGSLPPYATKGGLPAAEVATGSFGYKRLTSRYLNADSARSIHAGITHMYTEGYREQSSLLRQNAFWSSRFNTSERREIQTSLLLARVKYGIPGGLNAEQFADNPRQARPGNAFLPGSVEQNASINRQYGLLGIGQQYNFNDQLSNGSWIFGSASFLDHPFITDYKRDLATGLGARSLWSYRFNWQDIAFKLQTGGELLLGFEVARNYENNEGQYGALNFEDEISSRTALYFLQADATLYRKLHLTVGLSYNAYDYNIRRLVDNLSNTPPYGLDFDFDPVLAPRLALSYELNPKLYLWGQLSRGFSPPVLDEIRTNEGSINQDLEAEKGTNYEIGIRGQGGEKIVEWSATAYYFALQQTITSYTSESSNVVLLRNAGAASQAGLETSLQLRILQKKNWLINSYFSAAYQYYRFRDYQKGKVRDNQKIEDDFSGNAIPGVAPFTSALALNLLYKQRFALNLTHSYTDALPLNDANTAYSDPFHLLQARLEYTPLWFEKMGLSFFVSSQNLLNERYSLGYDLNPYGERFFQPAPGRSFFAGITLSPL